MVVDIASVPCGTTLSDLTHKGIRQGGNKSTLAFRNDIGIPGYTGFNPSGSCLAPQPKGNTIRTGKVPDDAARLKTTLTPHNQHSTSMYNFAHGGRRPEEYKAMSMHGNTLHQQDEGGYWIEKASLPGPPKPFTASTTYREEMLNPVEGKERSLQKTSGMSMTTVEYHAGKNRVSSGIGTRPVYTAPAALTTSKGDTLGYKTMYNAMVLKDPLTGGAAAPGGPRQPSQSPAARARVLPHAMPSGLENRTMYRQNFGNYGHEPLTRVATRKEDMTLTASTYEINMGTCRTTKHIPGYGGFMAESQNQPRAVEHSTGHARTSHKVDMLLYNLDQYSRERLPKYQGSRAQANCNIRLDEKPSTVTSTGNANFLTLRKPPPTQDKTKFTNSNAGTGSFFTDGGTFKSDNGKFEADRYYMSLRPMEGHPGMKYPDKRTVYGGVFTNPW